MKNLRFALLAVAVASLAGCAAFSSSGPSAVAKLESTRGNATTGMVTFTQTGETVKVMGEVRGLKPNAEHGFHVHEKGDCSSGDGMGTGGHFNPNAQAHGAHGHSSHHAGDLASLKADASGVARFSYTSTTIAVGAGATDVLGRGLIVHRDADDYKTQPTGNSGPRVACAVITKG